MTTPPNENPYQELDRVAWRPWVEASVLWLGVGAIWVPPLPLFWTLGGLAIADLIATAGLLRVVIGIVAGREKNGLGAAIRASSWGTIKLACVGLLTVMLWRSKDSPPLPLIMGLATLIVVPIIGGIRWHLLNQRNQRFRKVVLHAR